MRRAVSGYSLSSEEDETERVTYMPKRWKNQVPNTRTRCSSVPGVVDMGYML